MYPILQGQEFKIVKFDVDGVAVAIKLLREENTPKKGLVGFFFLWFCLLFYLIATD